MTAVDLLKLPRGRFRVELVEGVLKQMPLAGHNHGRIGMRLAGPLFQYVTANKLGEVYLAETGFKLRSDPDTVLAPDIAFIRRERVEQVGPTTGYWIGAPDLAAEVVSPRDTATKVNEKVTKWLAAGAIEVWVINPKLKAVTVYRSSNDIDVRTEKETLDGGEVVPGFQIPVAEIFDL